VALDEALADAASVDDDDDGELPPRPTDNTPEGAALRASGVAADAVDIEAVGETKGLSMWFSGPSAFAEFWGHDYHDFGPNPGKWPNFHGYILENLTTGLLYRYTYNDYLLGKLPQPLDPRSVDYNAIRSIHGVFADYLCCFYGNLPKTLSGMIYPTGEPMDLPRDQLWKRMMLPVYNTFQKPVIDPAPLNAARAALSRSVLGSDPMVKYGLAGLNAKLIAHVPDGEGYS